MDEETVSALVHLKKERSGVSLPVIIAEARAKGIIPARYRISYAILYRIFKKHGVSDNSPAYPDRRRFEAELPNDLWQSDCLHGPTVLYSPTSTDMNTHRRA